MVVITGRRWTNFSGVALMEIKEPMTGWVYTDLLSETKPKNNEFGGI